MGPIEDDLREAFYPALFGEEEVSTDLREILGHSAKHIGLGIPEPRLLLECAYNTSKSASEVLVGSIIGGNSLNYVSHKVRGPELGYLPEPAKSLFIFDKPEEKELER